MVAHKHAHGDSYITPKHHWMFDICEQMRDLEAVVDAFIIERLHLRVKRMMEPISNLAVIERSTLAGVVNAQFEAASKTSLDGLRGKSALHDGYCVADYCCAGSLSVGTGDAVFRENDLGFAAVFVEDEGKLFALVHPCAYRSQVSKYGTEWDLLGKLLHT